MEQILSVAATNLLSPAVLFFVLGFAAAIGRSDLEMPQAAAKALSLYLLLAIGFKGGVAVNSHGIDQTLIASLLAGFVLSAAIPLIAVLLLKTLTRLPWVDIVAVSAHYGSISIVTFVTAAAVLDSAGMEYEGYMVAVAAIMETPAIVIALLLLQWGARSKAATENDIPDGMPGGPATGAALWREIALNGSIVLLTGAFIIGLVSGETGMVKVSPFLVDPFQGVLCLFLLDMGLVAGRGMRQSVHDLSAGLFIFGTIMPLIGGVLGALAGDVVGLSIGGITLLAVLAASASYIAVPAAMRLAIPEARPSIYLTLSLGVTFPFNLTVGIPVYMTLGTWLGG